MKDYSFITNAHPSYIDSMYEQYLKNPESVEESWAFFFRGFEYGQDSFARGSNRYTEVNPSCGGRIPIIWTSVLTTYTNSPLSQLRSDNNGAPPQGCYHEEGHIHVDP